MEKQHGYLVADWERAKVEMRQRLVERATVRWAVPYSDLVNRMTTIRLEPNSYALAAMLGNISGEEDDADRGLLTVIVVHKDGDMQPGAGVLRVGEAAGPQHPGHPEVLDRRIEEGPTSLG